MRGNRWNYCTGLPCPVKQFLVFNLLSVLLRGVRHPSGVLDPEKNLWLIAYKCKILYYFKACEDWNPEGQIHFWLLFSVEKKLKLKIKYGSWIASLLYTEDGETK